MRTLKQKMKHAMVGTVAMLTLGMSGTVAADPPWARGGYYGYREHHHYRPRCHDYPPQVVEHYYYPVEERVVYAPPPRVVYSQPVVQYTQPAYPQYGYDGGYGGGYGGYAPRGDRLLSSAVLGAAGGFLGNQVGHGSGRAAATAAGAVAGWVLGGNLGR